MGRMVRCVNRNEFLKLKTLAKVKSAMAISRQLREAEAEYTEAAVETPP